MHVLLTGNTSFKIANFRAGLIHALHADGHTLSVLAPEDEYTPTLKQMGCQFIPLKMSRNGTNPFDEWHMLRMIDATIKRIQPDFVFGYTIKNNIYAGLSCRRRHVPFVPNVTGLGPAFNGNGLLNRVIRGLYRLAFARARKVFFQNRDDRALFTECGLVPAKQTDQLPGSGVDLTQFQAQPLPSEADGLRCLLVARLLRDKGVALFADAAARLRDSHPQIRCQLLGPLDPDSKTGISQAEIDGWVQEGLVDYLGSTTDVRPFLAQAHCIVLPSFYREGTPRSLLEGAALGRPIITTDMPGCRDVVRDGKNGILIAPQDVQALADALARFAETTPQHRQSMGDASRALMEAEYDEQIVINAYRSLLEG